MSVTRQVRRGREVWLVRWTDESGRRRERQCASEIEARVVNDHVHGRGEDGLRLAGWFAIWWAQGEARWRTSTKKTRLHDWEAHILPTIGLTRLADIDRPLVKAWRLQLLEAGATAGTVNNCVALLSAMLTEAAEDGKLPTNPCWRLRPLPESNRAPLILLPETIEDIRARMLPRDALQVSLMAYAGLRPEETYALRWAHVDFARRALVVREAFTYGALGTTKTGTTRVVPFCLTLQSELEEARRVAKTDLVVPSPSGKLQHHSNWHRLAWQPAVAHLTPRPVPYDCRHSFASYLIFEGQDVARIARWMGHSTTATTHKTYITLIDLDELVSKDEREKLADRAARARAEMLAKWGETAHHPAVVKRLQRQAQGQGNR